MYNCNLTGQEIENPIYVSNGDQSITSLSKFINGTIEVYLSDAVGHLVTKSNMDVRTYYDQDYKISIDSADDDQIYSVVNGKTTYRLEHQAKVMLEKLRLKPGSKILDFGCAKGGVMKRVLSLRGDIKAFLFDVSEMYIPFWEEIVQSSHWSSYTERPEWHNAFDVVTSFFVLEHVEDPLQEVAKMRGMLREDGLLYFIVPNVYLNKADFILSDHINHFSSNSIKYLMAKAGFKIMQIDDESHTAALIVIAKKSNEFIEPMMDAALVEETNRKAIDIAHYWRQAAENIQRFEAESRGGRMAIYGAGVYGNFIASCLKQLDNVQCFVDQNPFLQGKRILGKPILAPSQLMPEVDIILVGLNPLNARISIDAIQEWQQFKYSYFYL